MALARRFNKMFVQGGKQEGSPAPSSRKPRSQQQSSQDFDSNSESRRSMSFARRSYDSTASRAAATTPPTDVFAKMRLPTSTSVDGKPVAGPLGDHGEQNLVDSPDKVTSKWSRTDWLEIVSALETAAKKCHKCGDSSPNPSLTAALRLVSQLRPGCNPSETLSSAGTSPRPHSRASEASESHARAAFPDLQGAMTDLGPSACPYLGTRGDGGGGADGGKGGEGVSRVGGHAQTHSGASSEADSLTTGMGASGAGAGLAFPKAGSIPNREGEGRGRGGGDGHGSSPDLLSRRLLSIVTRTHDLYAKDNTPNGSKVADFLLSQVLELTQSPAGFICSAVRKNDGSVSLKTHSITNFAWTRELRLWYTENAAKGLVFSNLNTLFGHIVKTNDVVLSNNAPEDPRSSGLPPGHPPINNFLGIPLFHGSELIGAYAVTNRKGGYEEAMVGELQAVTKTVAQIVLGIQGRKKAAEKEKRMVSMLKSTVDAIVALDDGGTITAMNRAARRLFGFTESSRSNAGGGGGDDDVDASNLPETLHITDILESVDGSEEFIENGLDGFTEDDRPVPAVGRLIVGGRVHLELSVSPGAAADVAYVITAREAHGARHTHVSSTPGSVYSGAGGSVSGDGFGTGGMGMGANAGMRMGMGGGGGGTGMGGGMAMGGYNWMDAHGMTGDYDGMEGHGAAGGMGGHAGVGHGMGGQGGSGHRGGGQKGAAALSGVGFAPFGGGGGGGGGTGSRKLDALDIKPYQPSGGSTYGSYTKTEDYGSYVYDGNGI